MMWDDAGKAILAGIHLKRCMVFLVAFCLTFTAFFEMNMHAAGGQHSHHIHLHHMESDHDHVADIMHFDNESHDAEQHDHCSTLCLTLFFQTISTQLFRTKFQTHCLFFSHFIKTFDAGNQYRPPRISI